MALDNILVQEEIDYVSKVITEAGLLAPRLRPGIKIEEKTGPHDRVTTADLELSQFIVEKLKEKFKDDVVISEEDAQHPTANNSGRVWLIDPIDGTDNYIANDGQYSVMLGLMVNYKPVLGWVFAPATETMYFGGPNYGSWRRQKQNIATKFEMLTPMEKGPNARVIMGFRDRKNNPWIEDIPGVTLIKAGSIGLKVAKVLENEADILIHISGRLKTWDTAGPVAIALGGHLDVGSMEANELAFPLTGVVHQSSLIIGRRGSVEWCHHCLAHSSIN